jgi:hypothetical protein
LKRSGVELKLSSKEVGRQEGYNISRLEITLVNGTNRLIEKYEVEVNLPSGILKHWNTTYMTEVRTPTPGDRRYFRFNEDGRGALRPRGQLQNPITFEYCTKCAIPPGESEQIGAALASELILSAAAWVEGNEYYVEKTIKQLALER